MDKLEIRRNVCSEYLKGEKIGSLSGGWEVIFVTLEKLDARVRKGLNRSRIFFYFVAFHTICSRFCERANEIWV